MQAILGATFTPLHSGPQWLKMCEITWKLVNCRIQEVRHIIRDNTLFCLPLCTTLKPAHTTFLCPVKNVLHWLKYSSKIPKDIYLFWRPSIECPTSRLEYNLNCPSLSSLAKLVISSVEILITRRLNNNHLIIVWNSNGCLNTRLNLVWYSNDFQIPDHFGDFCLVFQCQMLSSWTDRYFNWAGTKAAS